MVRPVLLFLLLLPSICLAQLKLYESTFNGGVVGGGYSNGATVPSGSGSFNVNIPSGSTIRRAYLIAGRCGNAPNLTVTLNGTPYTFSQATNSITSGFQTLYGGSSGVHAIDITAAISPATTSYTIAVPVQSNTVSDKFPEFYLYIAFNNAGLPAINSAIYLNTVNLNVGSYSWNLNTTQSVGNGSPVGFAILGGYATTGGDCENVTVNGTALGSFGGQDFNASSQWGCMAGFQYYNNTLTGYNDDNANQAISGVDALSNIQAVLPGSTNNIPVIFTHCSGGSDNHVWATFLTWGGTILDGNILAFDAQPLDAAVRLNWSVETEAEVDSYELQRSLDGQHFETIGQVHAEGMTSLRELAYDDEDPRNGSNWYRVRLVGKDGVAIFSEVREVVFDGAHALAVGLSPVPQQRGRNLSLQLLTAEAVDWTVTALDGREVLRGRTDGHIHAEIPTANLAAGSYVMQLRSGARLQQIKFVME